MSDIIQNDPWEELRRFTQARIALGRSGTSIPATRELEFRLAHAHARDAVYSQLNVRNLLDELWAPGLTVEFLQSQALSRAIYLQRPDLGRLLSIDSEAKLRLQASASDIAIIIVDGLSATAINLHATTITLLLVEEFRKNDLKLAPVTIVQQGRVAIGDPIGAILQSQISIVLIGERPGLTAADSIGAYITYGPRPGLTDETRNCVSNIRPAGLPLEAAAGKITYLVMESLRRKLSGVNLKDAQLPLLPDSLKGDLT